MKSRKSKAKSFNQMMKMSRSHNGGIRARKRNEGRRKNKIKTLMTITLL
jgi:hypothetical protein